MKKSLAKNLFIASYFTLPLLASANTLQVNAASNNLKLNGYSAANTSTGLIIAKSVGQVGSLSVIDDKASLLSIAYLAEGKTGNNKISRVANQSNSMPEVKHSTNVVSVPSALPLLATAVGLFCFGANRRRV